MKKWQRIIRFAAQLAVVGIIIKALRGPVRWNHGPGEPPRGASR